MQNVWFKSRTRDVCGRFVVAVSFAEGMSVRMEHATASSACPMPWKFGCRSCVAVL